MIWLLDCSIISIPYAQSLSLPETQLTLPRLSKQNFAVKIAWCAQAGSRKLTNALAVQISKEITYRNKSRLSGLSHKTDAKSVWKAVRQVTGTKHSVTVADGISAESLNDHYANISPDQDYSHPKLRSTCSVENQEFVSEWTVFQMLDQLRPTSKGLDCLPAWFLKLGAPVFCKPIAYLFNLSITECFVPQQWKTAWISPIPKVPVPKSHTDYRVYLLLQYWVA